MAKQAIETTRGKRLVDVHKPDKWIPDEFYKKHRGGRGAVIVVFATLQAKRTSDNKERIGIFGSIETAQEWAFNLGDVWHCAFVPFVVDEPEFGNASKQ